MSALAEDRNTMRKYVQRMVADDAPVAANTTCYNGGLVASNAGNLCPASDTTGLTVLGVAQIRMVNATGSAGVIGPPEARVAAGVFKFDTSGADPIVAADIGKNAYVLDDHTVVEAAGTTHSIVAGIVDSIDDDGGIWVRVNC